MNEGGGRGCTMEDTTCEHKNALKRAVSGITSFASRARVNSYCSLQMGSEKVARTLQKACSIDILAGV